MMKQEVLTYLRRLEPWPLLDEHGKWVLLVNAKTGTGSMTGVNSKQPGALRSKVIHKEDDQDRWNRIWDTQIVPNSNDVVFFTFVRNPWDRLVSAFHYLQQGSRHLWKGWSFQRFVKEELAAKGLNRSKLGRTVYRHVASQFRTCYHKGVRIPEITVGRFERLQQDWAALAKKLDADPELPHLRTSRHAHYTTYYDAETTDAVTQLYVRDAVRFGYTFGDS